MNLTIIVILEIKGKILAVTFFFVLSKWTQRWRLLSKISCLRKSGLRQHTLNKNWVVLWIKYELKIILKAGATSEQQRTSSANIEHLNDKKRVTLYNLINGNRSNNVKACNFHAIEEKVISEDLIGARKRNLSGTFPDLSYFRSDRTKYQTV